jgi:hypothetical protein
MNCINCSMFARDNGFSVGKQILCTNCKKESKEN